MYSSLKVRLMVALSLTCEVGGAACKKDDTDASSVDGEEKPKKPKKPNPPPKKVETWTLPGSADKPVHCGYVHYCTTGRPKVTYASDSGTLVAECGSSVQVP